MVRLRLIFFTSYSRIDFDGSILTNRRLAGMGQEQTDVPILLECLLPDAKQPLAHENLAADT